MIFCGDIFDAFDRGLIYCYRLLINNVLANNNIDYTSRNNYVVHLHYEYMRALRKIIMYIKNCLPYD